MGYTYAALEINMGRSCAPRSDSSMLQTPGSVSSYESLYITWKML